MSFVLFTREIGGLLACLLARGRASVCTHGERETRARGKVEEKGKTKRRREDSWSLGSELFEIIT